MALTKISTGMLKADAASVDLNIDAGTLFLDVANNRIGVANTSPDASLHVVSGTALTAKFEGATNAYMDFTDGSVTTRFQNSGGFFIGTESNHNVSIKTGGTGVKMTVTAAGNVGICLLYTSPSPRD